MRGRLRYEYRTRTTERTTSSYGTRVVVGECRSGGRVRSNRRVTPRHGALGWGNPAHFKDDTSTRSASDYSYSPARKFCKNVVHNPYNLIRTLVRENVAYFIKVCLKEIYWNLSLLQKYFATKRPAQKRISSWTSRMPWGFLSERIMTGTVQSVGCRTLQKKKKSRLCIDSIWTKDYALYPSLHRTRTRFETMSRPEQISNKINRYIGIRFPIVT